MAELIVKDNALIQASYTLGLAEQKTADIACNIASKRNRKGY